MIVNINNDILNNLHFDYNMKNGRLHGNQKWFWKNKIKCHCKCYNDNQEGISIEYE